MSSIVQKFKSLVVLTSLLLLAGGSEAWAQTDYSGTYFIANDNGNYSSPTGNNYYMVPAADPTQTTKEDAYYSVNYNMTPGDPEKPYITTYKTNRDNNSIWQIQSSGDGYYYIRHWLTGKYLIYKVAYPGTNAHRKAVHLEMIAEPGDDCKFDIQVTDTGIYSICPISLTSTTAARFLNPASGNKDAYNGQGSSPYYGGLVGVNNNSKDKGSKWHLEDAVAPPSFSVNASGAISLKADEGTTIRYTTNGDDPTAGSDTYSDAITPTTDMTVVKAIAVRTSDSKTSNVASLPLQSFTYYIVNRSGDIAIKQEVKQAVGKSLSSVDDIPTDIRSSYLAGEIASFYSFSEPYTSIDQLTNEVKIDATPSDKTNIYVTYTTDHLSEKFLHLRGARGFNIKTAGGFIYDNNGTLSYEETRNDQTSHLWYISGGDPYNVQIQNVGTGRYLVFSTTPALALAATATNKLFIIMAGSASGEGYEQVNLMTATGTGANNFEKAEVKVYPVDISVTYELIDRQKKLIDTIESNDSELKLPDEWISPLVSAYHFYKTASIDGDVYTLSNEIHSTFDVESGGHIYVNYEVSDDIDLDGRNSLKLEGKENKTYMLRFLDGESFYQEDGSDGIMTEKRKAVYPYNNGDVTLYVYGNERWDAQLAQGASTRSRWLWYIEPANNPANKAELDPYHVKVSSYQKHIFRNDDDDIIGEYPSYLRTYKPEGYAYVVTNVTNSNPLTNGGAEDVDPGHDNPDSSLATEYMIVGTASQTRLVTLNPVEGERRTVNSFEQYWKNRPTVQGILSSGNKVTTQGRGVKLTSAQKAEIEAKGWHVYEKWALSAPWVSNKSDGTGGTKKQYKKEEHASQTIDMGSGNFVFEEVSLDPQVILLDQHGWEVVRVPLSKTDVLSTYNSPMVEQYQWYSTSVKVLGYHKYNVSGDPARTTTSLSDVSGVPEKAPDYYVTYTVKSRYANTYIGAAKAENTKASAFLLKQGGKYAQISGYTIVGVEKPTSVDNIGPSMQWYLRPNFDIDKEMGYLYQGESGAQTGATTKDETEQDNYNDGKNGFDPYNVQIQSKASPWNYFTANSSDIVLSSGAWTGTSSTVSVRNIGIKQTATGHDQTKLNITNATFMVVSDANGNMRLMPRFDNTKVANSDNSNNPFTTLAIIQSSAASADDEGTNTQTLWLELVPTATEIHSSSEITELNGHYLLAEDFTFDSDFTSLGTYPSAPFTGIIDGQYNTFSSLDTPLVAYASGAIIRNLILESVTISGSNDVGAICNVAEGDTRIYNCGVNGGEIGGTTNVGGIVGLLKGSSRVINCYSYANITSGTNRAGIVGYNNETSTQASLTTMIMNCMFYGDISSGGIIAPVYGGKEINNGEGGLNTYNYYRYEAPYSRNKLIYDLGPGKDDRYNRALPMYDMYLSRFERYRLLLNSNRKLAAKYASTASVTLKSSDMAKWVLETADKSIEKPKPYPVLKVSGVYPSIINYDVENALDSAFVGRNHGGKLGNKTLIVNISGVGSNAPEGAAISLDRLTLKRTDKDFDRFNFNYDKVQLPYYNDVGSGNYSHNRAVTGWKITDIEGGTTGTYTASDSWGGYNFADRKCTNKDLYSESGRVFSQGAYFDVPNGVTEITIEPYWATVAYASDKEYDVVYTMNYEAKSLSIFGNQYNYDNKGVADVDFHGDGNTQKVYTSIDDARKSMSIPTNGKTVYDYAVVLVGNVHQYGAPSKGATPYTVMSIDLDYDNEPDYSYIFSHDGRVGVSPIRYDFINIVGVSEAQMPKGASSFRNVSIFNPIGWYEITNTCVVRFGQFEYDNGGKTSAPLILLGGAFEQFVSTKISTVSTGTQYIHIGSNVWFANFGNGTHSDGTGSTQHIPISVTGGDYDGFYLTSTFQPDATAVEGDNAECYISGGRFGEIAGASLEQLKGDVQWQINWADITNFFGGGINAKKPVTGKITTDIMNSHVGLFCGGPKFGDMTSGKDVETTATNCTFDTYCGAGYGGTSYNRVKYWDEANLDFKNRQVNYETDRGKYYDGKKTSAPGKKEYGFKGKGIATDFDYEYFVWSTGQTGGRFYVKFADFSLATTNNVKSTLNGCTITHNFYGGGYLGRVIGKAKSDLSDCRVKGNVFGAGYSATLDPVYVLNTPAFTELPKINKKVGIFEMGKRNTFGDVAYRWKKVTDSEIPGDGINGLVTETDEQGNEHYYIYTTENLETLGQVGEAELTLNNTTVGSNADATLNQGNVFGGGEESSVNGNTKVTIDGGNIYGSVFGGGDLGSVGTFNKDEAGKPTGCTTGGKCTVTVTGAANIGHDNMQMPDDWGHVFGAGRGTTSHEAAEKVGGNINHVAYVNNTEVTIGGNLDESDDPIADSPLIKGAVYGGSENGHVLNDTWVKIVSGQIGVGDGVARRYTAEEWNGEGENSYLAPCKSWEYASTEKERFVYDPYADKYDSKGGALEGKDGHSYYGNVFGGGSGVIPDGPGVWNEKAGIVEGNTKVEISGGHILTNVYGGNECTNVTGKSEVIMTGGTVGVPRTKEQILANPVPCHVFGGGKGDKRVLFNTWTNVENSFVTIKGGTIYGSVYGGGEDGHILADATTSIGAEDGTGATIGTKLGDVMVKSGYDGNVFGGGQGSVTALTAGVVGGNVYLSIKKGTMYGEVYGGGRLASVGTRFEYPEAEGYGELNNDGGVDKHGNIIVDLTGGNIFQNAFGGCMGTTDNTFGTANRLAISRNVQLDLNKAVDDTGVRGCAVQGKVFGCNNMNASPRGDVIVHVYKTQNAANEATQIKNPDEGDKTAKVDGRFDVQAVYGGGNLAAYEPVDTINTEDPSKNKIITTQVIIEGDQLTSIGTVFGGGYGAATPATRVKIDGTYEIGDVFGGGDGSAAVVNGDVIVNIGTEDNKARITGNIYGGGNEAATTGEIQVNIGKKKVTEPAPTPTPEP